MRLYPVYIVGADLALTAKINQDRSQTVRYYADQGEAEIERLEAMTVETSDKFREALFEAALVYGRFQEAYLLRQDLACDPFEQTVDEILDYLDDVEATLSAAALRRLLLLQNQQQAFQWLLGR